MPTDNGGQQRLRDRISGYLPSYDFSVSPGLALMSTVGGKPAHQLVLGKANLEHDVGITLDTVFHTASVSKQFTAFVVAMLMEEGLFRDRDSINEHLPNFPTYPWTITLDHLVRHTSGLRDQWDLLLMAGWRLDDVITSDQIWQILCRQCELNFKPGSEMLYSNSGYSLLYRLIEQVTGSKFDEYFQKMVPLDLPDTSFACDHERVIPNRAESYKLDGESSFKKSVLSFANAGATALTSTVRDLCKWLDFQNEQYSQETAVAERVHSLTELESGEINHYAYGILVRGVSGHTVVCHDGSDAGFNSATVRIPEAKLSVAVLSNGREIPAMKIAFDAVEEILGADVRPPPKHKKPGESNQAAVVRDSSDATYRPFVGRYASEELRTSYDVASENGRLLLRHPRHPEAELSPRNGSAFAGPQWIPELTFQKPNSGSSPGFTARSSRIRDLSFRRVAD